MRNLQIIGNVPQVRKENNFGEYAEEAVIIEEQPKVKKDVYKRQFREYGAKITASAFFRKGKIFFRLERTEELYDYLLEKELIA